MALPPGVDLATDEQKVSHGFGLQFGDQLLRNRSTKNYRQIGTSAYISTRH